jgi:hypothetical protein
MPKPTQPKPPHPHGPGRARVILARRIATNTSRVSRPLDSKGAWEVESAR